MNNIKQSFNYITGAAPKILILGSMPGEESLARQQYYAHPRNAFWPIIFDVFKEDFSADYNAKKNIIIKHKLALWDVLKNCEREGSLDSNIKETLPNDINGFLDAVPSIKAVFFNGKAAQGFYYKFFAPVPGVTYIGQPSTSPANAQKTFENKLILWEQAIRKFLP